MQKYSCVTVGNEYLDKLKKGKGNIYRLMLNSIDFTRSELSTVELYQFDLSVIHYRQ